MKRRAFSLLEILVSISIASILFSVLFFKIRDFVFLRKEIASAEHECLERQALQIRLEDLFSSLAATNHKGESVAPFYYQNDKIHFQTVRQYDVDPSFATNLSYTLWLDPPMNTLNLSCKNPDGAERTEILSSSVLGCSFCFYSEKETCWHDHWLEDRQQSPSFVQLICKKKDTQIEYLIPVDSQR